MEDVEGMKRLDDLSIDQLLDLYNGSTDDDEIYQLEDALARKRGFANADEEWIAAAESSIISIYEANNYSRYTTRTKDEDETVVKTQPFYVTNPVTQPSNHPSHLCELCRHFNFFCLLHNLLPAGECLLVR